MGFYSFRVPRVQTWVAWAVGGSTLLAAYVVVETARSRRGAVPLFPSARVLRTEEHARYPCVALKGLDVVVRNFYVAEDDAVRRSRERGYGEVVFLSDEDRAEALRRERNRPLLSLGSLRHFFAMFSNEANNPGRGVCVDGRRVLSDKDDVSTVRLVVGGADMPGAETGTHEHNDGTAAEKQQRPFVASTSWPPHTEKFAALVLEPSRGGSDAGVLGSADTTTTTTTTREHLRDPLRWLADTATHQSLIRCRGRSPLVDMNCDADPTYLGAAYLRVMLAAFLLLPSLSPSGSANTSQPLRVAVLGVAGGSLPNFLQQYFSSAIKVMDLVDVEPQCFLAAAEQLGMGKLMDAAVASAQVGEDSGLGGGGTLVRAHASDAAVFLAENQRQMNRAGGEASAAPPTTGTRPHFLSPSSSSSLSSPRAKIAGKLTRPYDVLFVDLFVGSELASDVTEADFLRLCKGSLTSFGVAAFNLPERSKAFVDSCERVFGRANVYTIPTPGSSNTIVLARGGLGDVGPRGMGSSSLSPPLPHLSHRVLYRRAQQLQQTYNLPYDLANHFPVWWRFW